MQLDSICTDMCMDTLVHRTAYCHAWAFARRRSNQSGHVRAQVLGRPSAIPMESGPSWQDCASRWLSELDGMLQSNALRERVALRRS